MTSPEINRNVDVINGDNFKRANGVLKGMVGKYLKSHTVKSQSYDRIQDSDLKKIRAHFNTHAESDLRILQHETIFNILWHFQLRGRENLRSVFLVSLFICHIFSYFLLF